MIPDEKKESLLKRPPVKIALFDFFKIGPGPSSSHTIGPMKAGADFISKANALDPRLLEKVHKVDVTLLGSLSATGIGHGTNTAVLAGLLGNSPEKCEPTVLQTLKAEPDKTQYIRLGNKDIPITLSDIIFGPVHHDAPYNNTMRLALKDKDENILYQQEYYSVGGGFIQWKGFVEPERGEPVYPFGTMRELHQRLNETGLTLHALIIANEMSISSLS